MCIIINSKLLFLGLFPFSSIVNIACTLRSSNDEQLNYDTVERVIDNFVQPTLLHPNELKIVVYLCPVKCLPYINHIIRIMFQNKNCISVFLRIMLF